MSLLHGIAFPSHAVNPYSVGLIGCRSLLTRLLGRSLEQFSRMCWATNWAVDVSTRTVSTGSYRGSLDVRLNILAGDALDVCDAISALVTSEMDATGGAVREGNEVRTQLG